MRVNGQAVRAARDAKGISRERLAARVDVSTSTVERIEQERGGPGISATTIYLIAKELGVELASLFIEEEPVA